LSNAPKNILFLSSWYPSKNHTTLGNFIQFHAEAVATINKVYVLYLSASENENSFSIDNKIINEVDTTIIYFKKNKLKKYLDHLNAFKKGIDYLMKDKKVNFDCIHMNIIHPSGWQALYLKKKYNIPYIISENWHGFQDLSKYKIGYFRKILIKKVIENASFVCPVSNQLKKALQSNNYNTNYEIVPNVVNTEVFKPVNKKELPFTFLHVSTLTDEIKNISGILNAYAQLSHSNTLLRIIGDGETDWIKKKASSLNIPDNAILIETEKTHDEIANAMQQSDCFVLFSNIENLPLVLIESMACGLPIITSDVGGIAEHMDASKGKLINAGDTESLTKSMEHMVKNAADYDANTIREYAIQNFSNKSVADQFNDLYNRAIENL